MSKQCCNTCKQYLPLSQFHKDKTKRGGYKYKCKECTKAYYDEWKKQPGAREAWKRASTRYYEKNWTRKKYGIELEEFAKMLLECNFSCEICFSKENLHIDHDHKTGKVRGILCRGCNHGLGNFTDSVDKLYRAIEYLDNNDAG